MTTMPLHPMRTRSRRRALAATHVSAPKVRAMDEEQLAELAERLNGAPVPGLRMSEREFVDWAFEHVDAEWVDGEVILMAPANDAHESVDEWLGRLIGEFSEQKGLGILRRNMFVRFAGQRRRRVPDLFFISTARRDRVRPTYVDGAPDLIVEIVSPDSQNRDRREKYLEYSTAGVREYWIIDPMSKTFDAYALRGRKYVALGAGDGSVRSRVLTGFVMRAEWLFERRPTVAQVLKELAAKG